MVQIAEAGKGHIDNAPLVPDAPQQQVPEPPAAQQVHVPQIDEVLTNTLLTY